MAGRPPREVKVKEEVGSQNEEPMLFGSVSAVDVFLQRLDGFEVTLEAHSQAIKTLQERMRRVLDQLSRKGVQ